MSNSCTLYNKPNRSSSQRFMCTISLTQYILWSESLHISTKLEHIVRIILKLRKEILVPHAYFVWQSMEHMPKVKVNTIKNIKTTVWAITFEPEDVESRRDFWLDANCYWRNTYQNYPAVMTRFASRDIK